MLAFILVKVDAGKDRDVLLKIKESKKAKRVLPTYGIYDLITEVEYDDQKDLDAFVFNEIRKIKGVKETATLTCSELLIWELGL